MTSKSKGLPDVEKVTTFPVSVEIRALDNGFVVRIDSKYASFYPDLENLAIAVIPNIRNELRVQDVFVGNC